MLGINARVVSLRLTIFLPFNWDAKVKGTSQKGLSIKANLKSELAAADLSFGNIDSFELQGQHKAGLHYTTF